jgi:hypothetical protein
MRKISPPALQRSRSKVITAVISDSQITIALVYSAVKVGVRILYIINDDGHEVGCDWLDKAGP